MLLRAVEKPWVITGKIPTLKISLKISNRNIYFFESQKEAWTGKPPAVFHVPWHRILVASKHWNSEELAHVMVYNRWIQMSYFGNLILCYLRSCVWEGHLSFEKDRRRNTCQRLYEIFCSISVNKKKFYNIHSFWIWGDIVKAFWLSAWSNFGQKIFACLVVVLIVCCK